MQKFDALEAENLRLRELLDSSFKVSDRVLIAELMAVEMDPYRHQVILNKGERDNAFVGQPLVDAYGIMGQILHTTPFTSTAMLITDPAHATPVQVNRNGLRSIAVGTGSLSELSLPHIPNSADIRVGDLLITSGLGGRFPPGYPVATVVAVTIDPGHPFAQVSARPLSHLDRSREVLLVWKPPADKAYGFDSTPRKAATVPDTEEDTEAETQTDAEPATEAAPAAGSTPP